MNHRRNRLAVLALAAALGGCAAGPDFHRPEAPSVDAYTASPAPSETASAPGEGGAAQRLVRDLDLPGQWWTLFENSALNSLVEQALKANPDLQAAQAALRVANENVAAQRGQLLPQVQANFSPGRQKVSSFTSSPLASGSSIFSLYAGQVGVSYAPDVFGLNRRQVESLAASAESQRFQVEATYLTLASNVVNAAIQESSLRAQVQAQTRVVDLATESLGLLRKQFALGAVSGADVQAQETAVAQARAALPGLERQLAQQRTLLGALMGRLPVDAVAERFDFDSLRLPVELPLGVPSQLVEHRPDVRAAEAQLHAASAQLGVAAAALLPQFTLNGTVGSLASAFAQLGTGPAGFWLLGASITQTLFAGGSLQHRKAAAEAALDEAGAQYRSVVIGAFRNVSDAIQAIDYDARGLKASAEAFEAAGRSLALTRRQLELGAVSRVSLLSAEQAYQQTLIALVQARALRYGDTVALFQALGGGWWNRGPEVVVKLQEERKGMAREEN